MSRHSTRDRTLALGGVFHGCALAHQVASTGRISEQSMGQAVNSVLDINAPDVESVYGSPMNIEDGLRSLIALRESRNGMINRYVIGILTLERILHRRPEIKDKLGEGIRKAAEQAAYFGSNAHESVVAALAELYKTLISPLGPRIMINGEAVYLENPRHADEIRALLLVSLRSAVLWRQIGGSRFKLIFGFKSMVREAQKMIPPTQ
ncbi:MAG: high frequency lysogenization protein HflD [Gammaproteobacteria bacterium]